MIPSWWPALLLGIASWRTFHLLAFDDILNPLRNRLVGLPANATTRKGGVVKLMDFIECPYCLGFWVGLAWWGAWSIWPHGVLIGASAVAIASAAAIGQRLLSSDS